MEIQIFPFSDSRLGPVDGYRLRDGDLTVTVLSLGATVRQVRYRGKELVCGFSDADAYLNSTCYYGATVGRCCNRMSALRLGGTAYPLSRNENGTNQLHGGFAGFDRKRWTASVTEDGLTLSCVSPDGEEGYPGELRASVTFSVREDTLSLRYAAVSDKDTAVNLTNHAYFNLDGPGGTVLDHTLFLDADAVSVCDGLHLPTGEHLPVDGTPFDFRTRHPIGRDIACAHPQLTPWGGYDNNFLLRKPVPHAFSLAARVEGKEIGMELFTDRSCVQFYTANDEHAQPMDGMERQIRHRAFCLETQEEPNACNFDPPSDALLLKAGERYEARTSYRFYPIANRETT